MEIKLQSYNINKFWHTNDDTKIRIHNITAKANLQFDLRPTCRGEGLKDSTGQVHMTFIRYYKLNHQLNIVFGIKSDVSDVISET
jgi:hypothetical protein